MEAPDTRCWETLPAYLTLIRVPVYPGDTPINWEEPGKTITPQAAAAPAGTRPFYRYHAIRH
jgi:hypothetical protein